MRRAPNSFEYRGHYSVGSGDRGAKSCERISKRLGCEEVASMVLKLEESTPQSERASGHVLCITPERDEHLQLGAMLSRGVGRLGCEWVLDLSWDLEMGSRVFIALCGEPERGRGFIASARVLRGYDSETEGSRAVHGARGEVALHVEFVADPSVGSRFGFGSLGLLDPLPSLDRWSTSIRRLSGEELEGVERAWSRWVAEQRLEAPRLWPVMLEDSGSSGPRFVDELRLQVSELHSERMDIELGLVAVQAQLREQAHELVSARLRAEERLTHLFDGGPMDERELRRLHAEFAAADVIQGALLHAQRARTRLMGLQAEIESRRRMLEQRLADLDSRAASKSPVPRFASAEVGHKPPLKKVFLSYSTKDASVARDVAEAIESRGLVCWYSGRDLAPSSEEYAEGIMNALDAALVVVVLVSDAALKSTHVRNELRAATDRQKPVLPVYTPKFDGKLSKSFEYFLGSYQRLELPRDGMRLAETVARLVSERLDK
jgi:TIR domain